MDYDYNRFVDECRANFMEFLKIGHKLKSRPKIYSEKNMKEGEFNLFIQECCDDFEDFLSTIPRIKHIKKESF